jgi:hypothetical protein
MPAAARASGKHRARGSHTRCSGAPATGLLLASSPARGYPSRGPGSSLLRASFAVLTTHPGHGHRRAVQERAWALFAERQPRREHRQPRREHRRMSPHASPGRYAAGRSRRSLPALAAAGVATAVIIDHPSGADHHVRDPPNDERYADAIALNSRVARNASRILGPGIGVGTRGSFADHAIVGRRSGGLSGWRTPIAYQPALSLGMQCAFASRRNLCHRSSSAAVPLVLLTSALLAIRARRVLRDHDPTSASS